MTQGVGTRDKVSILLPTFNGEQYIEAQIRSILNQSFDDFELLIYDDGSSDGTCDILNAFAQADSRIRLFANPRNEGQNRRLLALLSAARGDLVAFADQDDIWDKRKLEYLYNRLVSSSCGLVFGASHLINAKGHRLNRTLSEVGEFDIAPEDRLRLLFFPMVSAHAMLAKRCLLWQGSFSSSVQFDWAISLDAQFSEGVLYEESAVTYHRIHYANQSNGDMARGVTDVSVCPSFPFPRFLLASGYDDRARLYKRLCYLAYSPIIPRQTQIICQKLIIECERAWFASSVRQYKYKRQCRDALLSLLLPLAGNARDRAQAAKCIIALCSAFRTRRSFLIAR